MSRREQLDEAMAEALHARCVYVDEPDRLEPHMNEARRLVDAMMPHFYDWFLAGHTAAFEAAKLVEVHRDRLARETT